MELPNQSESNQDSQNSGSFNPTGEPLETERKLIYNPKIQRLINQGKIVYDYIPIFTAVIFFKNGGKCTFYSYELRTSISQIRYQNFYPEVDLEHGYKTLVRMIEEHYYGKSKCALIYSTVNRTKGGKLLRRYNDGVLDLINDPDFGSEKLKSWVYKRAQHIKDSVMACDICIDYSQRKHENLFI